MRGNDFSIERPGTFLMLIYQGRLIVKFERFSRLRRYSSPYNFLSMHEEEAGY